MNDVERLARLFRGLERAHGVYDISDKRNGTKKVEGRARTARFPVTPELWVKHVEGKQGLGIVPIDDKAISYFGAIDVDRYDIDINDVEAQCATIGLPLLTTRTKSGGIHLYCFTHGVPAQLLRSRMNEWCVALGFGGAEIFPKQNALLNEGDVGNWINMPYFGGDATDRYGVLNGERLSLAQYLDRGEGLRVTEAQLLQLVIEEGADFEQGPPCLQALGRRGFGEGQRNKGLFAIGVYLKKRFPEEWQSHFHTYNDKFMKPPLNADETKTLIKSLARKEYNYACSQDPIKSFCNRTLCRTRDFGIGKADAQDWGITIDSEVQRVETDPPYWLLTVNGTRMQFFSDDLMRQPRFQELCMQKIAYLPPTLPREKWVEEINKVLVNATPLEAPTDSSPTGELQWHLQQYCTVYPQAETREEVLVGKPFPEEGFVYFRAADFKRYLESQHFRVLSGHRLYAALRELGVSHQQLWISGQNVLVWKVAIETTTKDITVPTKQVEKGAM